MVCDNMSLGDHALYEVRAGLQVVPDNEKRGGNLMLFQGIQGVLPFSYPASKVR